jgi:hypothetical protein
VLEHVADAELEVGEELVVDPERDLVVVGCLEIGSTRRLQYSRILTSGLEDQIPL